MVQEHLSNTHNLSSNATLFWCACVVHGMNCDCAECVGMHVSRLRSNFLTVMKELV